MGKRKQYTDEFRASAVLMLEAAGYPDRLGSLKQVSDHIGVPARTISRWFKGENNTPPDKLVSKKRVEFVDELVKLRSLVMGHAFDTYEEATFSQAVTAVAILTDKHQLLTGNATERTEIVESPRERLIDRLDQRAAKIGAGRADHVNDGSGSASPTA